MLDFFHATGFWVSLDPTMSLSYKYVSLFGPRTDLEDKSSTELVTVSRSSFIEISSAKMVSRRYPHHTDRFI